MRSAGFARDAAAYEEGSTVSSSLHSLHGETHPIQFRGERSCRGRAHLFTAGTGRFSIGITNREGKVTYHLHLSEGGRGPALRRIRG